MVKEQLLIDVQLAQAILDYLAQRPYHEVYQLIAALQRLVAPPPAPKINDQDARQEKMGTVLENLETVKESW